MQIAAHRAAFGQRYFARLTGGRRIDLALTASFRESPRARKGRLVALEGAAGLLGGLDHDIEERGAEHEKVRKLNGFAG